MLYSAIRNKWNRKNKPEKGQNYLFCNKSITGHSGELIPPDPNELLGGGENPTGCEAQPSHNFAEISQAESVMEFVWYWWGFCSQYLEPAKIGERVD